MSYNGVTSITSAPHPSRPGGSHQSNNMSMPESAGSAESYPITDRVREAMAVSLRNCEELLPQADWLRKLARAEATGQPVRAAVRVLAPDEATRAAKLATAA